MEFKPSVVPRRISNSDDLFPLGARRLHNGRESSINDGLHRRETSKLESELQESTMFSSPRVDHRFSERETREASVKLATATVHNPGSYNRSWSGSFLESRNRLPSTAASFQSSANHESERPLGAYSRLHNQQDNDSKRPKLSSGSTPTSGAGSSLWRGGQIPSTSPGVLGSASGTELRGRPLERATPVMNNFGSHSHRTSSISSLSCSQDEAGSRVQGARPKDASFSTLNTSSSRSPHLSSEHYSSLFSRDASRNTARPSESVFPYGNVCETEVGSICSRIRHSAPITTASRRTVPSSGRYSSLISRDDCRFSSRPSESVFLSRDYVSEGNEQDWSCFRNRQAAASTVASERTVSSPRRSFNEPAQESDGRFTARQLLSRLASSMSNTFLRRSSSESLYSRSDSASPFSVQRTENSTQSRTNTAVPEVADSRPSESPQSFGFLRRRRQGFISPSHQSSVDVDVSRQYNSEGRSTGSWLSSSIRSRCTPLFSRTRREGRDESARTAATSDDSDGLQHPFTREPSLVEEQENDLLTTADSGSVSAQMVNTATSTSSSQMRNARISRALPPSLLRFAMPAGIGSNLSDSVLITVDIMPSVRDHSEAQQELHDSSARDPEKLRKLQESLLLEDSEEEGDLCRICQMGDNCPTNPLIEAPCKCTGSLQYVHQECMKKWLISKINSGSSFDAVNTCELCKEKLNLNLENFDIHELYRAHAAEQAEFELISSGLYLVVLFHLCDQRFSNMLWAANEASTLRFFNLARSLGAQMDDLETSDESEDESEDDDHDLN